ncbi:MAG: phosphate ABC transporter permease subunit PstC [Rhodospirillaceae bacterium]|jgi:phosphate transport system permease protein|nr:phosphate ABC transporter permease subunit PstC [Rhodospirillaceae bacterium]MBT4043034.1 phosphate ABC transporter permease subunit PstC [Rhodospirillaceae bacterium]MBT4690983.1 phosphate ABC transporter permease subunit PstC [Rhodospirillaceae bacterium]MBT5079963.1 phosphate ABC transporter permease subunit PstC [Rhodospirillaceae bacterium]MBT5525985.1 phosphate ABC transporter permease subunit PstC [Rhodospirillaceae bacterium]
MSHSVIVITILAIAMVGFRMGRGRALTLAGGQARSLNSLPAYHGGYVLLWCALPALMLVLAWLALEPAAVRWLVLSGLPDGARSLSAERLDLFYDKILAFASLRNGIGNGTGGADASLVGGAEHYQRLKQLSLFALAVGSIAIAGTGLIFAWNRITPAFPARRVVEGCIRAMLVVSSALAIFTTIGIVLSLLFETIRFFEKVPIADFLFGLKWSPQMALRADQVGSSGAFGAVPIFAGTLLISLIAMAVAVPIGLMSAIYLSEYAGRNARAVLKPMLEILAGIPTVVYGFFAALTVAPLVRDLGTFLGLDVASESALAAGLVMGIMIIPFVSSLSDDVINAVPVALREGAYGLGATKSETILRVVLPAALPGIVGSILLAMSRAIGETMIVVMAAGLAANLTANPFAAVTTVTVQIVTLLVGDQEFDSAKTLAAFALGLVLFAITLGLNIIALMTVRKYREKYD